ncbi:MAG TPA: type VI secretion protein IcmF/TssM N-terminal domain-containing protein, partial [Gemmatimonadaceae bacterium]
MIAWIRTHMGLVILGVGVLMMAIMGAYSLLSEDEYEDEDEDEEGLGSTQKMGGAHADTTLELPESEARKSRMLALKDSLDRSLQTRVGGVNATKLDRLAMPWFMLVGTEGSGKKSLLASTGLPLPFGAPVEVDSVKKDAGRWWLFEQAVVVEAPTARSASKVAPSDVTAPAPAVQVDISESWNNLLHLLRRERPDSPLNGIIVTVSCADLVGTRRKSPEEIAEQAELIRAFLEKTKVRINQLAIDSTTADGVIIIRGYAP